MSTTTTTTVENPEKPATEKPAKVVHTSSYILKRLERYPDLIYDGEKVICPLCNVRLVSTNLFNWRKHLKSQKHQRNKKLNLPYARFLSDFVFLFGICNIPFNVLDKKSFRHFWKKFAPKWHLPSRTSAWRRMGHIKTLIQEKIRQELKDNQVWLTVDLTPDAKGNKMAHVLARVLHPNEPSPPYLLASKKLQDVTAEAIQRFVMDTLTLMEVSNSQLLMLVTDSARNMLKAGRLLKCKYENLLHVTCIVHILHVVAEEIRRSYPTVDRLISSTKQVFEESEIYTKKFYSDCPDIPLPPQAVLTRAITWLEAVSYFNQHFHKIKSFILELNPEDSRDILEAQTQFSDSQVEADIRLMHDNYSVLGSSVKKLEGSTLSLAESLNIFDNVQATLENLKDATSVRVNQRFAQVLKISPDYRQLQFISQCLIDKYPVDSLQPFFAFASITSVDVERSFPHYSSIFSARRRRFVETNMEALLLIEMYAQAVSASTVSTIQDTERVGSGS